MTVTETAALPTTAARTAEFISLTHLNSSTELNPVPAKGVDLAWFRRYVRSLEDGGYDYTLLPYGSSSADPFVLGGAVAQLTERIKPIIAVRPNLGHPLVAAQKLATLDQLSEGRAVVHLISGGSDAEQARHGDYLPKERRYARTEEFATLLRRAWEGKESFSHAGEFYQFDEFGPGFATYSGGSIPVSIGGSSDEAFEVGGRQADIFSFWGEPLDDIAAQIQRIHALADAAGRPRQRIWVTFRPIIAETEELAWAKAHRYVDQIERTFQTGAYNKLITKDTPQNVGSQRALEFANRQEVYDRALWTRTAAATNGGGAATALVGTPETVAAAILDYVDLGADLVSIRGYDTLNDAVDYGRYVIPLVRQELAHRQATGQRGTLQDDFPGAFSPDFERTAGLA